MKTLFYSVVTLLAICVASSDAKASTLPFPPSELNDVHELNGEEGGVFKIRFVFERGRKNEAGECHDRGVCRIEFEVELRADPGGLDGEILKDRYGNILLIIEKGSMSADDPIDITGYAEGPGTLHLSNNSDIPEQIKTELGLPSKYQFKAGSYQVTETATTYIVNFRK